MAADSAACISAGAAEIHVHPRDAAGSESLTAVDETVSAMRAACPGTLIGVSTGAWIEGDAGRTLESIARWRTPPDYASVNLAEPDAPSVMAQLDRMGVGIEAGLAMVADAERFVSLPGAKRVLRVLLEVEWQDQARADAEADGIAQVLAAAGIQRPLLLHGFDALAWHFVARAFRHRWSTRIGLEDCRCRPDGSLAEDNATLVTDALAMMRPAGAPGT